MITGRESLRAALRRRFHGGRISRESALALIEDTHRWECAYVAARDEVAALRERLIRAAYLVENLAGQVPEFTGVVGPGGEREDDYIRDNIVREADEWREIARG